MVETHIRVDKKGCHKIHFSKFQIFNCSSFQITCANDKMGLILTMTLAPQLNVNRDNVFEIQFI
jgi:hypothetical protein